MHLDGCVPAHVIWNAAKRNGKLDSLKKASNADTIDELWDWISVNNSCATLQAMLNQMNNYFEYIIDDEIALRELCHYVVKHQYENKIYYTETRYCPHKLCNKILTPWQVIEIISDELNKRSKEYGIIIKQILCCMRSWLDKRKQENMNKTLDELLIKPKEIVQFAVKARDNINKLGVVGIDLAGNESDSNSKDGYDIIFKQAKFEHNLNITIHAGEGNNIDYTNIYDAIENLYAQRIGHGYRTIDSKELLSQLSMGDNINISDDNNNCKDDNSIDANATHMHLKDREDKEKEKEKDGKEDEDEEKQSVKKGKYSDIHLECCPTSSIITNSVSGIELRSTDYRSHPIRCFNDNNVNYSISTDDPQVLRCTWQGQLSIVHNRMNISINDIKKSIIRAAKHSFLDKKEKDILIEEIKNRIEKYFKIYKPKDNFNDSLIFTTDKNTNTIQQSSNGNSIGNQQGVKKQSSNVRVYGIVGCVVLVLIVVLSIVFAEV